MLEKFVFPNVKKVLKFQNKKNKYNTAIQYKNTINTKKLCLSYKFINKKCHDMIYLDSEWKSFLLLWNKHDFSLELFSNLFICYQPPKQVKTWWFSSLSNQRHDRKLELLVKKNVYTVNEWIMWKQRNSRKFVNKEWSNLYFTRGGDLTIKVTEI